jgi:hypothetical protein
MADLDRVVAVGVHPPHLQPILRRTPAGEEYLSAIKGDGRVAGGEETIAQHALGPIGQDSDDSTPVDATPGETLFSAAHYGCRSANNQQILRRRR